MSVFGGLDHGVRWGVMGRGSVWGFPRYERFEGFGASLLNVNMIHCCGGKICKS